MNNCSWYLWLGGRKIYNIRQLRENFDTALLTGYFLGGSLMKWLSDLGEYEIIKRLSTIDTSGDIGRQLEFAFGVSPDRRPKPQSVPAPPEMTVPASEAGIPEPPVYTSSFLNAASSFLFAASSFPGLTESSFAAFTAGLNESSFASAAAGSFGALPASSFGTFAAGSFTAFSESSFSALYESYFAYIVGNALAARFSSSFSSFSLGSYSAFVTGQALNVTSSAFAGSGGSFSLLFGEKWWLTFGLGGSFSLSSFGFGSFEYFFGKYGQFTLGSFAGSFYGSFLAWLTAMMRGLGGSFGSGGSFGDIRGFFGTGSFRYNAAGVTITAEEFHRTLINLSSCPLNAYGYGINLI